MELLFWRNDLAVYFMEIQRSLSKVTSSIAHLPTWFFIIGYPLYWIDLYTHDASHGVTSSLSWLLYFSVAVFVIASTRSSLGSFKRLAASTTSPRHEERFDQFLWLAGFGFSILILGIVFIASLKPIHLLQEYDCLQYHYTLPRQHLILGSFGHIPWAADDLFMLPVDFALSPFWFATNLPNKLPQFIIFLGLLAVAMRLSVALAGEDRRWAGPLVCLIILGTHGFTIQMGTGMLDLAIVYLFLAALDSIRLGNWFLAAIEFAFFFWSKPLMPLEVTVIIFIGAILFILARRLNWQIIGNFEMKSIKAAFLAFVFLSFLIAGPFITKSIQHAATPFFPLAPGILGMNPTIKAHPQAWHSLKQASQMWMVGTKNSYGHGRDLMAFIKHWWLVAVPEKGVNNSFDYPLGLTYLLMIGPFFYFLIKDIVQRRFSVLSVLVVVSWLLWWFTAQQSRFLYLPLILLFLVVIARFERISKVFIFCVVISLAFETISLWNAHKADMGRWGVDVLRVEDRQLLELNRRYKKHALDGYLDQPTHDVAYAEFPVMIHKENLPHTVVF